MSAAALAPLGEGRFELRGDLDFSSVAGLLQDGLQAFGGYPAISVDLAHVGNVNSAGLALLLEWRDQAAQNAQSIRFQHLPDALLAISRISNVEHLLSDQ